MASTTAEIFAVVVDDTSECAKAVRYAVLRARNTSARVLMLHVLPPVQFLEWRGAQKEIEDEQVRLGEELLRARAIEAEALSGERPDTQLVRGRAPQAVLDAIRGNRSIRALVLGAAAKGRPGPLVDFFAREKIGNLPCMVILIPGGIADADLDRLT